VGIESNYFESFYRSVSVGGSDTAILLLRRDGALLARMPHSEPFMGRSFKDGEGSRQTETEWHRITCFNGIGKAVAENIGKGAMLFVQGRIHYSRWTDSEGQQRYGCEIIAEQIDFLSRGKRGGADDEIVREMALPL